MDKAPQKAPSLRQLNDLKAAQHLAAFYVANVDCTREELPDRVAKDPRVQTSVVAYLKGRFAGGAPHPAHEGLVDHERAGGMAFRLIPLLDTKHLLELMRDVVFEVKHPATLRLFSQPLTTALSASELEDMVLKHALGSHVRRATNAFTLLRFVPASPATLAKARDKASALLAAPRTPTALSDAAQALVPR